MGGFEFKVKGERGKLNAERLKDKGERGKQGSSRQIRSKLKAQSSRLKGKRMEDDFLEVWL
jgi:hypothetical protein